MLQKNIVKNKTDAKYSKWFEFAEKTKNPDNKEEDFLEYMDDEIFCEIMKRKNDEGNCKINEKFRTLDRKDFRNYQSIKRRN